MGRKILGILLAGVFILTLGIASPILGQNQAAPPSDEEVKTFQVMAMINAQFNLEIEKAAVEEIIGKLEAFRTEDAALKEKIKNWLPVLKEYQRALENLMAMFDRFINRPDVISETELQAEVVKYFSLDLNNKVIQVIQEMQASGIIEKLFPPEK